MEKPKCYMFDVADAVEYGLQAAVILWNFRFWIAHNKANKKHRHDGRTWTYCSIAAMTDLFPFFSTRQIRTILEKLIGRGILIKGLYNPKAYDRTTWYAFGDEKAFVKADKCNSQNGQLDSSGSANPSVRNGEPIPDKKHIGNPDNIGNLLGSLSGKPDPGAGQVAKDKIDANRLLVQYGVNQKVASNITHVWHFPPDSIWNVIQNGLARELTSRTSGNRWRLNPGYIVAAINNARNEGKTIPLTKTAKKMTARLQDAKKVTAPMSPAKFNQRRNQQMKLLDESKGQNDGKQKKLVS